MKNLANLPVDLFWISTDAKPNRENNYADDDLKKMKTIPAGVESKVYHSISYIFNKLNTIIDTNILINLNAYFLFYFNT